MSTQNEQYQQALANFKASQVPLNSSPTVSPSCCVRIAPIPNLPINITTSGGDENNQCPCGGCDESVNYYRVLYTDGSDQGTFSETWSVWPQNQNPNPNPGGGIDYNVTYTGAVLYTKEFSNNSRAELRDGGNHVSNLDALLPLTNRLDVTNIGKKCVLKLTGTALQEDNSTMILIGFYKCHASGANIDSCDNSIIVGPVELAVAFRNWNGKWHCLVHKIKYNNYDGTPQRRDINCVEEQITHFYDTGYPTITNGNDYNFCVVVNQSGDEAKFYINNNLVYTADNSNYTTDQLNPSSLPYYPPEIYAYDSDHNMWRGCAIRKLREDEDSQTAPVSGKVGQIRITEMKYVEYFSE